jgi:glycosyltransferase involved in cell wall biosynthesis
VSDTVATVSDTTQRLMRTNKLTKRPISVIYNAAGSADHNGAFTPPAARPKQNQSLVYMGSFMDYKNVEVLIDGMKYLPDFELNLLSKISPQRRAELEDRVASGGGKVIFHNGVSDEEYHRQLEGAVALVSGSQDEGFGIPLVEAMSLGIPVVASDIEIFREIGGSAAIYFDQNDAADFASQVTQIETNAAWMKRSAAAKEWSQRFDWNDSADSLLRVIGDL